MLKAKNNILQRFTAILLAVAYALVVVFSNQLHHHKPGFQYMDSEKSISKFSKTKIEINNSKDCLACHFNATHYYTVPQEMDFQIQAFTRDAKRTFEIQEQIWSQTKYTFQRRGPPSYS